MSKQIDKKLVRKIAIEYIFTKTTYRKLAEKYNCSSSKISYMMNYDLLEVSRILYALAELKARSNMKKNLNNFKK